MTIDFRASQVQTNKIIASGSSYPTKLVIYPVDAQDSSTPNQGLIDPTKFNTTALNATDTFMYVSGAVGSKYSGLPGTTVFGGDLYVSGNIFSEAATYTNWNISNLAIDATMTGDTFVSVGAAKLVGQMNQNTGILGGTLSLTDTIECQLVDNTDGTIVAEWSATGLLQTLNLDTVTPILFIGNWYMFKIRTTSPTGTGLIKGVQMITHGTF